MSFLSNISKTHLLLHYVLFWTKHSHFLITHVVIPVEKLLSAFLYRKCSSKNQIMMVKGIFLLQMVSKSFYLLSLFTLLHTKVWPATSHSPRLNFASLLSSVFPIGDVVFSVNVAYFHPCTCSFPFKMHFKPSIWFWFSWRVQHRLSRSKHHLIYIFRR